MSTRDKELCNASIVAQPAVLNIGERDLFKNVGLYGTVFLFEEPNPTGAAKAA